jgi:hypothetical protein
MGVNVEVIKQETVIVDTIADLLLRKIQHLPAGVHETLKITSLLGFCFEVDLIADVLARSNPDRAQTFSETNASVSVSIKKAVQNGLIKKTNDGCQLCHDQFQSSF